MTFYYPGNDFYVFGQTAVWITLAGLKPRTPFDTCFEGTHHITEPRTCVKRALLLPVTI